MTDGIGCWYARDQIREIASSEGFDCHIVTAWYYEYRFHARLNIKTATAYSAEQPCATSRGELNAIRS
jgi:hypothetical protein